MSGDLSIDSIADKAKSRHYKLVVDCLLPGPNNSTLINKTWQEQHRGLRFNSDTRRWVESSSTVYSAE